MRRIYIGRDFDLFDDSFKHSISAPRKEERRVKDKEGGASQREERNLDFLIIFSHTCEYPRVSVVVAGPKITSQIVDLNLQV